jgi:hypothetical protein
VISKKNCRKKLQLGKLIKMLKKDKKWNKGLHVYSPETLKQIAGMHAHNPDILTEPGKKKLPFVRIEIFSENLLFTAKYFFQSSTGMKIVKNVNTQINIFSCRCFLVNWHQEWRTKQFIKNRKTKLNATVLVRLGYC